MPASGPPSELDPQIEKVPALRLVEAGLPAVAPKRSWLRRHSRGVSVAFAAVVAAALVIGLWGKRDAFTESLGAASASVLAGAVALQLLWLIARSEAWHVCVVAAGGTAGRRALYRAAAIGYLGNLLNNSFGLAVRIAELRRTDPIDSPRAGALVAAELPIIVIEAALAAICSFTLIGPLGLPWWVPVIALVLAFGLIAALRHVADRKREGFWQGFAVVRGLAYRNRIIALTILAVSVQVLRNWLVLRGIGVDASLLDSVALLVATAVIGLLPVGPTLGVTSSVLILGSKGVAAVAAAGALLTATGAVGALCFASWSLADRFRGRRPERRGAP
ncbi:MAG TPA: lysylphosphatidylglycerol synthase domain-containing protein [Tepidiformaceae bacterium]|nr:lysylphosphatidylglycerol synthase domain-containing protein [Tepidiformaceae bacterium]